MDKVELNWVAIQRQRYLVGLDARGDIKGIAQNVGELHGKGGMDDPTDQLWNGHSLLGARKLEDGTIHNVHESYMHVSNFTDLRSCIEEDLTKEQNRTPIDPFA